MGNDDRITIPEDLTELGDKELHELLTAAVDVFQRLVPEDEDATDEALESLAALADGIEALKAEVAVRDKAALDRANKVKELTTRVLPSEEPETEEEPEQPETDVVAEEVEQPVAVAAAATRRRAVNINLSGLRAPKEPEVPVAADGPKTVGFAAQGASGFDTGTPLTMNDMALAVSRRLGGFNSSSYALAASKRQRVSERHPIAKFRREFADGAVAETEDAREAMTFAANEKNTPKGSLVASGGWCAPSETLYDLCDISEAANLISIPEIQINRGGIRFSMGPDFSEVFADTGFCYTEEQDIAGDYDGNGGGTKPCTVVPCPDFEEYRLGYCGVCISAGMLQQRGYPEVIEDYIRKTLNAHAHRMSASVINTIVAGSTLVTFPGPQAGAAAPLLTAADLQATHYRAVNRMSDTATLEAVFPTWAKAVFRADLARRLGLAEFEVSDSRIAGWFSNRNISAQYVVDWQDIATTPASGFTAAPTGMDFLLFAAGTWVKGVTDSISLENIYDSVLLGTNDYTALFTEDPFLVAQRCAGSRLVRVPICPDGATHEGVPITCSGTTT